MFSQSIYGGNSRKKLFDISGLKNNAKKKNVLHQNIWKSFNCMKLLFFIKMIRDMWPTVPETWTSYWFLGNTIHLISKRYFNGP